MVQVEVLQNEEPPGQRLTDLHEVSGNQTRGGVNINYIKMNRAKKNTNAHQFVGKANIIKTQLS